MIDPPTFTCPKAGCDHRPGPGCPAYLEWIRYLGACVGEGYCPYGHGRLDPEAPVDGDYFRVYGVLVNVVAVGVCHVCSRRWIVGEKPERWFSWRYVDPAAGPAYLPPFPVPPATRH